MIPQRWSVPELLAWARRGYLEERFRDLLRPKEMVWSGDREVFADAFAALQRLVPASRRHLVPQGVIAATLFNRATSPAWVFRWLPSAIDLPRLGIPLSWETLFAMQWSLFPLVLTSGERASLYYVLAGVGAEELVHSHFPTWWRTVVDSEAGESMVVVLRMLRSQTDRRFFFWPLLPFDDRLLVHGPSLALPFLLAAHGLLRGHPPGAVVATGTVGEDGSLGAVGGLASKAAAALREGFAGFLYPRPPQPVGEALGPIERLEAQHLQEALFLWETYEPAGSAALMDDLRVLAEPRRLAASALLLGEETLRWKGFGAAYGRQIEALIDREQLLEQFLTNLEQAMNHPDYSVNRIEALLAPFSPQQVAMLAQYNPLAAFRITQLQLAVGSRQGQVGAADRWSRVSDALLDQISATEHGLELKAGHLNRELVLQRHGRYDFRPDLPAELTAVLKALKALMLVKKQHGAGMVSASLGRLYGTIAQNYGFCGPAYLQEVEQYVALAQAAFGGGLFALHEADWRRQCCYRFYALLDAGQTGAARQALDEYLGFPLDQGTETDYHAMNRYQHAALARYLAEQGGETPLSYLQWSARKAVEKLTEHPWQLWLNNVGGFAAHEPLRKMLWYRSTELALELGAAARPMALLPLANLRQSGQGEKKWLEERTRETRQALQNPALCREHFFGLLKADSWEETLSSVLCFRDRLFPFSYR